MAKGSNRINLKLADLVYPYFVVAGKDKKELIKSFPGVYRFSVDRLLEDIRESRSLGLRKILLFGIPRKKDDFAASAYKQDHIVAQAVREIKQAFPDLTVVTDVCLCAYTVHGHCGILKNSHQLSAFSRQKGRQFIDNSKTLEVLSKIALAHAEAGADWVAPSAMAKKQVFAIRNSLDKNGFSKVKILGYSAKFASNFYGPFREAANSAPLFGDRRSYQLDYHDSAQALTEIAADIKEGADMVMVKPALGYLDIIKMAKQRFPFFPLASYNTSGEYAMVKIGVEKGLWDEKKAVFEIIASIKRAGADLVITYHAKEIAKWLKKS